MVPAPLSYDSLKTVLQYMEANKRSDLSRRIPSLRSTDRATPFTINTLVFNPKEFTINNTNYQVSIYHKHRSGRTPDVNVEKELLDLFHQLLRHDTPSHGDISLDPGLIEDEDTQEQPLMRSNRDHDKCIRLLRTVHNRNNEECIIEVVHFTKKLPDAVRYLTTHFLGNRRQPITVRNLIIPTDFQILRLPMNLKFNVGRLHVRNNLPTVLPGLSPILRRLDTLDCSSIMQDNLKLEVIRNTRCLIITKIDFNQDWMQFMQNLDSQSVHLKSARSGTSPEDYLILVRHWLNSAKKVGTYLTIGYESPEIIKSFESLVMKEFGGLSIPMRYQAAKLVISFKQKTLEECFDLRPLPWCMKMEVVE